MSDKIIHIREGLFNTKPLRSGDGYTFTLVSRLSDMLFEAEALFGERDKVWTILGVEIYMEGEFPQNWYPGGNERKHIVFQLISPADIDEVSANYQLAHEVIHSLSPKIGTEANVLEEGVATWFAKYYVKKNFNVLRGEGRESYKNAREKVEKLLVVDENAIKKLRAVEPCFKKMTVDTFERAGLFHDKELIGELLTSFNR